MKYNRIPGTDLKISAVGLGTWVFGSDFWGGSQEKDCVDAVAAALDWGVNWIDTAPIYGYGLAERIVGRALKGVKGRRDERTGEKRTIHLCLKREAIIEECEYSLKRLGTDYIDLYQCHWPDPRAPLEKTMEAMMKLKAQGKIRYIGVSNFDIQLLRRTFDLADVVTLQSQYSMIERSLEKEVLPFLQEKKKGVLAYGPLAGGILTGKYTEEPKFKDSDARAFFYKFYTGQAFTQTQRLIEMLRKIGKPLNQIAINWVRQQPGVAGVIVGCRDAKQLEQNATAANWDLSVDQVDQINALLR